MTEVGLITTLFLLPRDFKDWPLVLCLVFTCVNYKCVCRGNCGGGQLVTIPGALF